MKLFAGIFLLFLSVSVQAQDSLNFTKKEVIYLRKDGMAITMLVLTPARQAKQKAIIDVVSGNWVSSYEMAEWHVQAASVYVNNGYTVFVVMHGSQPRYTIPEEVADLKRAVRFIRYNAAEYKIDPDHIGITGYSSGGHLSLEVATTDDLPVKDAEDPVDKVSSRVQAAAVFYPPTDFLNWGQKGFNASSFEPLLVKAKVAAAFDFKIWSDSLQRYIPVSTESRLRIAKEVSPIYAVSTDDPPLLIVHGDNDPVVPLQQSQTIITTYKAANLPAELIVKKGGAHGWKNQEKETQLCSEWFDKYLK